MKTLLERLNESSNKKIETIIDLKKDSFNSDVYHVLTDLAYEYENANISISEDDWHDALAWFNDKFFVEPDES